MVDSMSAGPIFLIDGCTRGHGAVVLSTVLADARFRIRRYGQESCDWVQTLSGGLYWFVLRAQPVPCYTRILSSI